VKEGEGSYNWRLVISRTSARSRITVPQARSYHAGDGIECGRRRSYTDQLWFTNLVRKNSRVRLRVARETLQTLEGRCKHADDRFLLC